MPSDDHVPGEPLCPEDIDDCIYEDVLGKPVYELKERVRINGALHKVLQTAFSECWNDIDYFRHRSVNMLISR